MVIVQKTGVVQYSTLLEGRSHSIVLHSYPVREMMHACRYIAMYGGSTKVILTSTLLSQTSW